MSNRFAIVIKNKVLLNSESVRKDEFLSTTPLRTLILVDFISNGSCTLMSAYLINYFIQLANNLLEILLHMLQGQLPHFH